MSTQTPNRPAGKAPGNARRLAKDARKREWEEAAQKRAAARQRTAIFGAVGGVVVIVAVIVLLVTMMGGSSKKPSTQSQTATTPNPTAAASTQPSAQPSAQNTAAAAAFPGVSAGMDNALKTKPVVKAGTGAVPKLVVTTLVQGKGAAVKAGDTITVNYVGVTYKDGKEFDSSWQRSQTFSTPIGVQKVIPGWDTGLVGVKVGSRVQLDIPAAQAYGDGSSGGIGGDLRFVVDVLGATAS